MPKARFPLKRLPHNGLVSASYRVTVSGPSFHYNDTTQHYHGLVANTTDCLDTSKWSSSRNFAVTSRRGLKNQRQAHNKSVNSAQFSHGLVDNEWQTSPRRSHGEVRKKSCRSAVMESGLD